MLRSKIARVKIHKRIRKLKNESYMFASKKVLMPQGNLPPEGSKPKENHKKSTPNRMEQLSSTHEMSTMARN